MLTAAALLAACSGSKTKQKATPTSTTIAVVTSTTVGATSTTTPGLPGCATSGLDISIGQGNGAAGHIATPIVFRNTANFTCTLVGYPGVAALDANGNQLAQASRTPRGMMDGLPPGNDTPPLVTLKTGASATAIVETSDVPQGSATSCPTYAGLLVTPPGETHPVQLKGLQLIDCSGVQVHPVQPGTS